MKRIWSFLTIFSILLLQGSSTGYGYESVLVKADDNQEVLQSKNVSGKSAETDIWSFLQKNKIYNVDDYAKWLEKNIQYQKVDENTDWASWQMTLNRRYGDCKNISALNAKVLEALNYQPILIGYKNASEGHIFTVFMKNGRLNVFDNTNYHQTRAKTIDQIGLFLYEQYNIETVFEVTLNPMTYKLLYTRAMLAKISKNGNNI